MWKVKQEWLGDRQIKYQFLQKSSVLQFDEILQLWQQNKEFRDLCMETLADVPFQAFRWETPPLTTASSDRPFEFVVINDPGLNRPPDRKPFESYWRSPTTDKIVQFANLGGDAWLIVPYPIDNPEKYIHLAVFMREAPLIQKHALFKQMGVAVQKCLGNQPVWLSTAGGGVAWLHVRLDSRPKYYRYGPYKVLA